MLKIDDEMLGIGILENQLIICICYKHSAKSITKFLLMQGRYLKLNIKERI
jgi:hypothetical protein